MGGLEEDSMNGNDYVELEKRLRACVIRGLDAVPGVLVPIGGAERIAYHVLQELAFSVGDLESYAAVARTRRVAEAHATVTTMEG